MAIEHITSASMTPYKSIFSKPSETSTQSTEANAQGITEFLKPSPAAASSTGADTEKESGGRSLLSPETIQYIIQLQIASGETPSTPEELQNRQAELRQEHFDRIASDPAYAAEQAKNLAESQDMLMIPNDVFEAAIAAGNPPGYAINDPDNPILEVQQQRMDLYNREMAKGTPAAEIYKSLLEFNLSLPDSYTEGVLNMTNSHPPSYYKDQQQSDLDVLNEALKREQA